MRFQIDTVSKTIKLEQSAKLQELIDVLEKMVPDWKDYLLETNVTINWTYPYRQPYIWRWDEFPTWPIITCGTASYKPLNGTYNVECSAQDVKLYTM